MKVFEIHYSLVIIGLDVAVVGIVDLVLVCSIHHLMIDSAVNWDLL